MPTPKELQEIVENAQEEKHKEETLSKIAAALKYESDRGCVIFGAALINESLECLLRAYFRQTPDDGGLINALFQGYAPLATFSAKLQIAYAFGIISHELREQIELVRRLRNDFAHESGPLTFADPRCASRLELLFKLGQDNRYFKKVIDEQEPILRNDERAEQKTDLARARFIVSLTFILGFLRSLTALGRAGLDIRERGHEAQ